MSFRIRNKRMGEWAKASIKKQNFSTESQRIIISFIFFIFHRIQQETLKTLHYLVYFLHFLSHSTRNIKKLHYFLAFSSFFIAFNKKWIFFFLLFELWPLTSWNVFSHHFLDFLNFHFTELSFELTPETSFLIIFLS